MEIHGTGAHSFPSFHSHQVVILSGSRRTPSFKLGSSILLELFSVSSSKCFPSVIRRSMSQKSDYSSNIWGSPETLNLDHIQRRAVRFTKNNRKIHLLIILLVFITDFSTQIFPPSLFESSFFQKSPSLSQFELLMISRLLGLLEIQPIDNLFNPT